MSWLLEPFGYHYMLNAMWVSALVGGVCAFLSCYLMLKGWSLIGDALSHSIVPGVAGAYMLGLPFALGAFLSGGLAAGSMLFLQQRSRLKEDAIIGLIFSSFFGIGLFMVSLNPTSVNIQTIILGNILAIAPEDIIQLAAIGFISMAILLLKWKDLMDRYVQHQSGAKHAGEDNPHDGIALESAVIVEKTGRHGAQQTGDKRADGEGDADNVGQHHARKDRVAHGVAHQRPAFEHQKHRQQRAGNGDDDRYRYRIDHKRKLERGQEQVQHAASLARRRLASRPCFGAKIKVMRNSSVCATTIMPPVAPSR